MKWPEAKPGYLPREVWDRARRLRDSPRASPAALVRLIGPDMAPTWEGLARRGVSDPQSWGLLLDLFATSAPGSGFNRELRGKIDRAGSLVAEIAGTAAELAELVAELVELRDNHGLSVPLELTSALSLLESAGFSDDKPPGRLMSDAEDALDAIPLDGVLYALADVAEVAEVAPGMPHEGHATTRKGAIIPEWVRAIDSRFRLYYASQIRPRGLALTDGDVARVCRAVMDQQVSERAVNKYRADAPAPLPCESVLFYPPE